MERWGPIKLENIEPGMRVRIAQRYYQDGHHAVVTAEGEVEQVAHHITSGRRGVLGGSMLPDLDEIVAVQLYGWRVDLVDSLSHRPGWSVQSVERGLPPLPTTAGSVVETAQTHLAAVLRHTTDYTLGDEEWQWADGTPGGPTEEQLASARIVYEAARR